MAENAEKGDVATQSDGEAGNAAGTEGAPQSGRSFAKTVLYRLVFPTIIGFPVGLGLFLSMQMDSWQTGSTATDRQPRRNQPGDAAQAPPPHTVPPLRADEVLQHADELLVAGDVVHALDVYEQLAASGQGQPGEMLEYRLAVCAELLGRRDRALAAYTALAGHTTDDTLTIAARLGAARVWFASDNLPAATTLLCNVLLEAALHKDALAHFGGDFANLLAHIRARQVHPNAPATLIDDLGIAPPPLSWSPLASLELKTVVAATPVSEAKATTPGVTILQTFGDGPADIQLKAHIETMAFGQIFQRLSSSTGKRVIVSEQAQQALVGKTTRVALDDVHLDELLDNLIGPFGLTWHSDESGLHIDALAELSEEQATRRLRQLANRDLHRAVTLYSSHPLCASSYLALGNQAFHHREYKNAISLYRHLQREYPRSIANREAWFNEAKAHLRSGDLSASRVAFLKVVDTSRGHWLEPAAHLYVGRLDLDSGKPRMATAALKRALSLSSRKEMRQVAAVTLASAYLLWEKPHAANGVLMEHRADLASGQYAETAAFLSALARFNALDEHQRNEVSGRTLVITATHTDANRFFGVHGFLLLGDAYQSLGYVDHMAKIYAEALDLEVHGEPRDRLLTRLAEYENERGNREQFENLLQQVVQNGHGPWPRRARLRLAVAALASGQDDECLVMCRQLLDDAESSDDDAEVLLLMGRAYEQRRDHYNAALCFAGMKPNVDSPAPPPKQNGVHP